MSELEVGVLKQEVLSLLVSSKNGLSEHELLNDYRMFNSNRDLPYRELGYPTLISLLRSWPDVCRLQQRGNNGAPIILAVEEENTKHILSMVKGQRQGKSRRRGRGGRSRPPGGNVGRENYGGRFSQSTFHANNNRYGANNRGAFNGRPTYNRSHSERSMAPPAYSNQNSRNKPNARIPPQPAKQSTKPHITVPGQPAMSSYDQRSLKNSQSFEDRAIKCNFASLQITVPNPANANNPRNYNINEMRNDSPNLPDTPSQFSEEDEEQYDQEEEVLTNLQTLLTEYSHGVRLLVLDNLYLQKFGRSLLKELKIANILLLQDFVDDFATISRHGEENGSCDHIITLKDPNQVAQTQAHLLQQITDSGVVPSTFTYSTNLFSYINDRRFQGFVSNIDKNEHCLHVQPVRYQEHIETLMEELDSYYSNPVSTALIIHKIETGLSCVTKYDGVYHRVFIKETDLFKCVIVYVDYGTTEEINKGEQQFKYLLKHFAELPCMAIACRLDGIEFVPDDNQWLPETYNEVYALCKNGPFFIEPNEYVNGLLAIRILDADERCLNDIVVEMKLAVKISARSSNSTIKTYEQDQPNTPKPVTLSLDFSETASHCPLPDSGSPTPENSTVHFDFSTQENGSSRLADTSSSVEHHCKLIKIDENDAFFLIRYHDNKPYIPCFNLACLLHRSEADILSETLLPRIHFQQTADNYATFDYFKQINLNNCLHIHQNFLFLFDLPQTLQFIQQLHPTRYRKLIETIYQQIDASNQPRFWHNVYDRYKPSTTFVPEVPIQSSTKSDEQRYNELLTRRNILCNMMQTNDVHQCAVELESIENDLQQLIGKMRLGAIPRPVNNPFSTPSPGLTTSNGNDQPCSTVNQGDKLKELMQRCQKLINTILVLDDYIVIDDRVIRYIQENLPYLNSDKNSADNPQLYGQYSELLENLTRMVNDLRQQLPNGFDFDRT